MYRTRFDGNFCQECQSRLRGKLGIGDKTDDCKDCKPRQVNCARDILTAITVAIVLFSLSGIMALYSFNEDYGF